MSGRGAGSDFVEALARGLDVLRCFTPSRPVMTLADVASAAGLARPTARRMLLTLEEVGMVRGVPGGYELTPQVLRLGLAYVGAQGLWEVARPHMEALVRRTGESSSLTQLDGSDIVYVARVAVPKIVALRVEIGTRFPAVATSQGKVLLAALPPGLLDDALAQPGRSGLLPYRAKPADELRDELIQVRARGWALADEELAPGIRSIAAPVRDRDGVVRAAMNINVHAAETSVERLLGEHLPVLLRVVGDVSADWAVRPARSAPAPSASEGSERREEPVATMRTNVR